MKRLPWDIVLALVAGLGLGVAYAWMISPLGVSNASPVSLRDDFKDHYRSAIAGAYAATGNLPRAQARLGLLNDPDPVQALNAQAQRMLANGEPLPQTDQVAALALALEEGGDVAASSPVPVTEVVENIEAGQTSTLPPPPPDVPILLTETPPVVLPSETPFDALTPTPRSTQTSAPTLGAPFRLTGQEEVCDANLPDGLLQVIIMNASRRQLPGMKIRATWEGGEEHFFTGLKPELGNGYADFIMTPQVSYTVQLASGSDIATGLAAPTCQTADGETFFGSIKLTFQQP